MHYKITVFMLASFLAFTGCNDSKTETSQKSHTETLKIKEVAPLKAPTENVVAHEPYTIDEIYNAMCIICHSSDGSGNTEKLTPSMKDLTQLDMYHALKDVEADKGHIIMEHNREQILKMGMQYKAEDMAKYMFKRFNK